MSKTVFDFLKSLDWENLTPERFQSSICENKAFKCHACPGEDLCIAKDGLLRWCNTKL